MTGATDFLASLADPISLKAVSPAAEIETSVGLSRFTLCPTQTPGALAAPGPGVGDLSYWYDSDPGDCSPPDGNTGGILPTPLQMLSSVEVGLDYITGTFSNDRVAALTEYLRGLFGEFEESGGGKFYRRMLCFSSGVRLLVDNKSDDDCGSACVEIPGLACRALEPDARIEVLRHFACYDECKFTRLDIAVDYRGRGITLLDQAIASCDADELVHARTYDVRSKRATRKGLTGLTLTIGARGKGGSGRAVCIYDKGLESETAAAREWIRWEARFYKVGGVADRVADFLLYPGSLDADSWSVVAYSLALGAIDFREPGARLDRRKRLGWWETWLRSTRPVVVKAERQASTLEGLIAWVGKNVAPTLRRFDELKGQPPGGVFADMFRHVAPKEQDSQVVREFIRTRVIGSRGEMLADLRTGEMPDALQILGWCGGPDKLAKKSRREIYDNLVSIARADTFGESLAESF